MHCIFMSGSTDMNNTANENSSTASVDDSISQTAKLDLASSSGAETDVKDLSVSSSESAKKTEIPMPTGPKTRQVFRIEITELSNLCHFLLSCDVVMLNSNSCIFGDIFLLRVGVIARQHTDTRY